MSESKMIFLNGSKNSFRCVCGCNVFTLLTEPEKEICHTCTGESKIRYECNSCREIWIGAK